MGESEKGTGKRDQKHLEKKCKISLSDNGLGQLQVCSEHKS